MTKRSLREVSIAASRESKYSEEKDVEKLGSERVGLIRNDLAAQLFMLLVLQKEEYTSYSRMCAITDVHAVKIHHALQCLDHSAEARVLPDDIQFMPGQGAKISSYKEVREYPFEKHEELHAKEIQELWDIFSSNLRPSRIQRDAMKKIFELLLMKNGQFLDSTTILEEADISRDAVKDSFRQFGSGTIDEKEFAYQFELMQHPYETCKKGVALGRFTRRLI